jgi:hypothetical protein
MTTNRPARELAAALSEYAEAVCRTYLSNGKKQGNHWVVGDIGNNPGQSLYVRLTAGQKAAGKWTDYVAPRVMLRPRAERPFCEGSAASPQHNLSARGVA